MEALKLSTVLVPLVLAMILTVLLLLVYESTRPVTRMDHNFIPLEKTFPDDDTDQVTTSCSTLTRCKDGSCKHCDQSYKCTEIGADEKVYFKGEKVPAGQWCLPPGKADVACGSATGRAIWTGREWKCACLYPDMYGGKDCTTPMACKASNAPGIDQSGNVLVDRNTGVEYDVTDTSTTPYDTDAEGRPRYICKCDSTNVKKFVSLPQDPYRCHLDPCSDNHEVPFWDPIKQRCDCTAKGAVNNEYAYSNVTQQCVRTPQCAWNDNTQQCMCPEGQVSYTCNSSTMKRKKVNAKPCPDIPGGSFCKNPCENYCLNGGIGTIVGDKCVCTCPDTASIKFEGSRCDDPCVKSGTPFHKLRCCSGDKYRKFAGEGPFAINYWVCR